MSNENHKIHGVHKQSRLYIYVIVYPLYYVNNHFQESRPTDAARNQIYKHDALEDRCLGGKAAKLQNVLKAEFTLGLLSYHNKDYWLTKGFEVDSR